MASKSTISQILNQISILQILKLEKIHINHQNKRICLFHQEKTASLTFYPKTNSFYCFGCHCAGNVINFYQKLKKLSFLATITQLQQLFSIKQQTSNFQPSKPKQTTININPTSNQTLSELSKIFHNNLLFNQNQQVFDYLTQKRKFTFQTLQKFSIGIPLIEQQNSLINYFQTKKIPFENLIQSNNFFPNDIIIPIYSLTEQVITFQIHNFSNSQLPKYRYLKTKIPLFPRQHLFGFDKTWLNIQLTKQLIIVEGTFDMMKAYQHRLKNCVALLGSHLSQNQLTILNDYIPKHYQIFIILDPDPTGKQASQTLFQQLRKNQFTNLKICNLPDNLDLDKFLDHHNIQNLNQLL